MNVRELSIPDCFEISPRVFPDDRGVFFESYRFDELELATGRSLKLAQANTSVSKRGVVRGIHFSDVPPSQAKYVMAPYGAVLDYVVDIRVGSPTFGEWDSVLIDSNDRRAVFIPEGVGHAFIALTDEATVTYLVTSVFDPKAEHGINPLDSDIGLKFPSEAGAPLLSAKDTSALGLLESEAALLLPTWDSCQQLYSSIRRG